MSDIKQHVAILQSRFRNHQYQTNNFRWDYMSATDEEVLDTTLISKDTIDGLSGIILKIIQPQHRTTLRRQIHYLTGLRERQAQAFDGYIETCNEQTNKVNKWVLQHEQ